MRIVSACIVRLCYRKICDLHVATYDDQLHSRAAKVASIAGDRAKQITQHIIDHLPAQRGGGNVANLFVCIDPASAAEQLVQKIERREDARNAQQLAQRIERRKDALYAAAEISDLKPGRRIGRSLS